MDNATTLAHTLRITKMVNGVKMPILEEAADTIESLATALAEREADRAEIARLTQALEAFGGEAAIEAKRLFDRMLATPRHTDKRRQLAAQHYEASKRAALARATLSDSQQ